MASLEVSGVTVAFGGVAALDGVALGVAAFLISHRTTSALTQGDAITIGLGGITSAVIGSALFLRFWMARQSYELNVLAERALSTRPDLNSNSKGGHLDLANTDS